MNKFWFAGKITFIKPFANTNSYSIGLAVERQNAENANPNYVSFFIKQDLKNVDFSSMVVGSWCFAEGYVSQSKKDDGTYATYFNAYTAAFTPSAQHFQSVASKPAQATKPTQQSTQTSNWSKKKQHPEEDSIDNYFNDGKEIREEDIPF